MADDNPYESGGGGYGDCPDGRYWNGYRCSEISPGSGSSDCQPGQHWEYGKCVDDAPPGGGCKNGTDAQGRCCPDGASPGADGACHFPNQHNFNPTPTGGGGGGGGPRSVSYNAPPIDWGKWLKKTPEELQALQAITSLAQLIGGYGSSLYNVGMPAFTSALNYYQALLGGNKGAATRAVAPQAELISEVYKGSQRNAESMVRGGARDTALAELNRSRAGQIGALIPVAQQDAARNAGALGLSGVQAGMSGTTAAAGLHAGLAQAEQTNRLAGLQAELQNKSLDLQRLLGLRAQDIQEMLGLKNIELGFAGLDVQRDSLSQAMNQFNQTFGLQQEYFNWYKVFQQQQMQQQQQQAQGSKWGSILGTALNVGGRAIPTPTKAKMAALLLWGGFLNG